MIRVLLAFLLALVLASTATPLRADVTAAAQVDALHARFERLFAANQLGAALDAAQRERDAALDAFGENNARSARAYEDVGIAAEAFNNDSLAEDGYRLAIIAESKILERTQPDEVAISAYLVRYGSFLNRQSRSPEAAYYLLAARLLEKKMKPLDAEFAASTNLAYAIAEVHIGSDDDMIDAQNIAAAIVEPPKGSPRSSQVDIRTAWMILGQAADDAQEFAFAEKEYANALAIHAPGDDRNLLYATLLTSAGRAYFDDATSGAQLSSAKLNTAERYFNAALPIFRRDPSTLDVTERYEPEEQLAELAAVRGEYDRSLSAFEALLAELRRVFDDRFPSMSENERLAFVAATSVAFNQFYAVASHVLPHRDTAPEMYDVALWRKGLVLRSIESLRSRIEALGDPKVNALFAQITRDRTEIAQTSIQPNHDPDKLFADLDNINSEEQDLAQALTERGIQLKTDVPTWQQVAQRLAPGEAAIEFVDTRRGYLALVLTHDKDFAIPLGTEEAIGQDALRAYRSDLGLGPRSSGATFYDRVWKPLLPALHGINRIYLSSDGVLDQMTLDAIADDSGTLLMQTYDIRRVASTAVLLEPARTPGTTTAYLAGDPQYYASGPDPTTCADAVVAARSAPTRGRQVAALPCTRVEVQEAGAALQAGGLAPVTALGLDASKTRLTSASGPRVMHIATHGFFSPDAPSSDRARFALGGAESFEDPMMRSGLILAGGGETWQGRPPMSSTDNGILTAYEAAGLNLSGTELVVLSACDSGLGTTTAGEGVFGLQRGFAEAGAHMVMMSMWDVPDRETQELLAAFYAKWSGGTDAFAALHAAETQERAVVIQRYGHDIPTYWAGFMLVMN